jgi:DNA modification methylase
MVAAALEGRRGIGIELEQKYFDVAKKRVEEATLTKGPESGIIEQDFTTREEASDDHKPTDKEAQ